MTTSITSYTRHERRTRNPKGVIKFPAFRPTKPGTKVRSLDKFFWYIEPDGISRLAMSTNSSFVPEQSNTYEFSPSLFRNATYPSSFPLGGVWPPQRIEDLACVIGTEYAICVGNTCYTDATCEDPFCDHTFEEWQLATREWEDHFELRVTEGRGIGVYTKRSFREGDIIGWYAGELKSVADCAAGGDYIMEMPVGEIPPFDEDSEESVLIDGERRGNWTRFINHSCEPHAVFRTMRVGGVRIIAVEVVRDVMEGVELTVGYGGDYYGVDTRRVCCCGTESCVGRNRVDGEGRKARVKRCKRKSPIEN